MHKRLVPRKLLVATAGVATVIYVACDDRGRDHPPGNLPGPPATSSPPREHPPGNLPAPPPVTGSPPSTASVAPSVTASSPKDQPPGNLPAPPPVLPRPKEHPTGNLPAPPPMKLPAEER